MKEIEFTNPHRRKHFEFFRTMNHPHFNVTVPIDITKFLSFIGANELSFSHLFIYFISRTANEIKEFRWRIRGDHVVEHEVVNPSFTVNTDQTDVFSFCTVPYTSDAHAFIAEARAISDIMKSNPKIEDEANRDDYLFLSALPWIRFTSMQHAMQEHPGDSVPRISWGKYYRSEGSILIPVSVQVHHALVDGRHVGAYFELLEKQLATPSAWLRL